MKSFNELISNHKKELDSFINENVFFAFSKGQLAAGVEKFGNVKIANIGMGGFCKSDKVNEFMLLIKRHKKERADFKRKLKDVNILKDMMKTELSNHEFTYTRDPSDALNALEISRKDMQKPLYKQALELAKAELIAEDEYYDK